MGPDITWDSFFDAYTGLRRFIATLMGQLDISPGEYFSLRHLETLRSRGNLHAWISDLRKQSYVSRAAISQMLNSLECKGLIKREMDKVDRRRVTVRLTEEGKQTLERANQQLAAQLSRAIDQFGPENMAQLNQLLRDLHEIVNHSPNEERNKTV